MGDLQRQQNRRDHTHAVSGGSTPPPPTKQGAKLLEHKKNTVYGFTS